MSTNPYRVRRQLMASIHSLNIFFINFTKLVVYYKTGPSGTNTCPRGYMVVTNMTECFNDAATFLRRQPAKSAGCWKFGIVGCFFNSGHVAYSTCTKPKDQPRPLHQTVCKTDPDCTVNYFLTKTTPSDCLQNRP